MSFGPALTQELQASLSKIDYLAFVIFLLFIFFGLNLLVSDLLDHFNNVV